MHCEIGLKSDEVLDHEISLKKEAVLDSDIGFLKTVISVQRRKFVKDEYRMNKDDSDIGLKREIYEG